MVELLLGTNPYRYIHVHITTYNETWVPVYYLALVFCFLSRTVYTESAPENTTICLFLVSVSSKSDLGRPWTDKEMLGPTDITGCCNRKCQLTLKDRLSSSSVLSSFFLKVTCH